MMTSLAVEISTTPPTWAGIITAAATLVLALTALLGGVTALIKVFIPILKGTKENKIALGEVHTLVNKRFDDSMKYQRDLIEALQASGAPVPPDQSIKSSPE